MQSHLARSGLVAVMMEFAMACGAGETSSQGELDIGIKVSGEANAADAGLPSYPGSTPYKDADESSSAANIGISTSLFGLKVVAMNLQTPDTPERVAAFYRRALAKYGRVLECEDSSSMEVTSKSSDDDGGELKCDADDPGTNSVVYKVGRENNQRIVAIKPHDSGTRFSLVHVDTRERK